MKILVFGKHLLLIQKTDYYIIGMKKIKLGM